MKKKAFKAESKRLLDLMINSIYTHKEIFLREIISNASDAIDKLCYLSLTDDKVGLTRDQFEIKLSIDKERRLLTVSDNGIGIPKEAQTSVFERFYRVDKSRSKATGGTGLGLAIVKHVLLHHNAQMKIESELGKGSTFTVVFPAERVSTKAAADVIDVAAKEKAPAAAASAS